MSTRGQLLSRAYELLNIEAEVLVDDIKERFYSGQSSDSLGRRTGQAVRGWRTLRKYNKSVAIVNSVKHADHSTEKIIRPTKKKFLAIPLDEALTKANVHRFSGPLDPAIPVKLSFIPIDGGKKFLLVDMTRDRFRSGKRKGKYPAYYLLTKEVKVPARTRGIQPFVKKRAIEIAKEIGTTLNKEIGKYIHDRLDDV